MLISEVADKMQHYINKLRSPVAESGSERRAIADELTRLRQELDAIATHMAKVKRKHDGTTKIESAVEPLATLPDAYGKGEKITQSDLDNLADIIWWIKGYTAGAGDAFEECPFRAAHVESLRKCRVKLTPGITKESDDGKG